VVSGRRQRRSARRQATCSPTGYWRCSRWC
jgi:hypothetical protein